MKILLFEDQTPTLHFLEQFCIEIYPLAKITLCSNQEIAMKHLQNHLFDFIVADLDFNGDKRFAIVELAMELQIPCIVYSAYYKPVFVRKAIALLVKAYICKLGKIEDLKFALKNYSSLTAYTCSFVEQHKENLTLNLDVKELILSPSEHKILKLLIEGFDRKEIAMKMKIKQATLNGYIKVIKLKNKLNLPELVKHFVYWHAQ